MANILRSKWYYGTAVCLGASPGAFGNISDIMLMWRKSQKPRSRACEIKLLHEH